MKLYYLFLRQKIYTKIFEFTNSQILNIAIVMATIEFSRFLIEYNIK